MSESEKLTRAAQSQAFWNGQAEAIVKAIQTLEKQLQIAKDFRREYAQQIEKIQKGRGY